MICEYERASII